MMSFTTLFPVASTGRLVFTVFLQEDYSGSFLFSQRILKAVMDSAKNQNPCCRLHRVMFPGMICITWSFHKPMVKWTADGSSETAIIPRALHGLTLHRSVLQKLLSFQTAVATTLLPLYPKTQSTLLPERASAYLSEKTRMFPSARSKKILKAL